MITTADPENVRLAIERLRALPAFYPTVQKALRLLEDPLSSNSQVQQVIAADQVVAARVLQLANSAYLGLRTGVTTVSAALAMIGRDCVATLLRRFLAEELVQMLCGYKPSAARIREVSLLTAAGAHSIARRLPGRDPEEVQLTGLLHNIGELVLLSQFREDYEQMLRLAQRVPRPDAERAIFGVASPAVGKWLLEAWGFPELFLQVVECWPNPRAAQAHRTTLAVIAAVHLAQLLASCWLAGRGTREVSASLDEEIGSWAGADRDFLLDLYEELPHELDSLRGALA